VPELGRRRSGAFLTEFNGSFGPSRDGATLPSVSNLVFHLCVSAVAGWINRGQQRVIEYLVEENQVLRDELGGRRLRLTDKQRRRLAVRARALGRRAPMEVACIVTPDTLLRWYKCLVAKKYGGSRRRRPGRSVVRENPCRASPTAPRCARRRAQATSPRAHPPPCARVARRIDCRGPCSGTGRGAARRRPNPDQVGAPAPRRPSRAAPWRAMLPPS
jgi:hypothetical protein